MPAKTRGKSALPRSGGGVVETLKSYYGFMQEHGLELLEIEEGTFRLKMSRRRERVPVPVFQAQAASAPAPAQTAAGAPPKPAAPAVTGETVKSPMMGIFYRAPSPSSPPYIKDGSTAKAGDIICMIEAMKVFNEIKAEFDCTVVRSLVENGKPVKLGQELFQVRRA